MRIFLFSSASKVNYNAYFKLSQLLIVDKAICSTTTPVRVRESPILATKDIMKTPKEIVQDARVAFETGCTRSLEFRECQLRNMLRMYEENEQEMIDALQKDLNKCKFEAIIGEINYLVNDLRFIIENFKDWAKPAKAERGIVNIMDQAFIYNDPYGVVLIMGAWNYPMQLSLIPLPAAIAAGNTVVIKPSEIATASADFIARTLPKYIDNCCYQVMNGGIPETTELLKEKFDYIFFTGSTAVAKIIHAAANKHLTPVTLELGGKSPAYLDDTVNVDIAARRILWGKCINAGQTCIAPDYLLCSKQIQGKFIEAAKKVLTEWYGENAQDSPDLCRIISDKQFKRISGYLREGKIAIGGNADAGERFIEPTVLIDVKPSDTVMQEEIFGPLLPIMNIDCVEEAVEFINQMEKPLALYIFSADKSSINALLENTSSGGVCVNDTLMHLTLHSLPFGGVGSSGMGTYHGKYSFDTFVHKKSTLLRKVNRIGEKLQAARYPPYSDKKLNYLMNMLRPLPTVKALKYWPYMLIFGLGLFTSYAITYITHVNRKNV